MFMALWYLLDKMSVLNEWLKEQCFCRCFNKLHVQGNSSCSLTCTHTYLLQPKTRRCHRATGARSWSKPAREPCLVGAWVVSTEPISLIDEASINQNGSSLFGAQAAEGWMDETITQPLIPQVLHAKCPLSGAERAAPSSPAPRWAARAWYFKIKNQNMEKGPRGQASQHQRADSGWKFTGTRSFARASCGTLRSERQPPSQVHAQLH